MFVRADRACPLGASKVSFVRRFAAQVVKLGGITAIGSGEMMACSTDPERVFHIFDGPF